MRKRLDVTLEGFARFARGKPSGVLLYLHAGRKDEGWDVVKLARRLGIEERLVLSDSGGEQPDLRDADLNLVYNACDVGINTASCEGFGLVALEHAATGGAQVMTDLPNLREIWGDAAHFLPPCGRFVHEETLIEGVLADADALAAALDRLYEDRELLEASRRRALERASQPELSWDAIGLRWAALLGGAPEAEAASRRVVTEGS